MEFGRRENGKGLVGMSKEWVAYGHASQDGRGDGDKGGGELGEDAHDDEEEAGGVAGFAVGAAGEGDDAVVLLFVNTAIQPCSRGSKIQPGEGDNAYLRKSRHGRNSAQPGQHPIKPVRQHPALNPRIEQSPLNLQPRNIARGRDIANRLHHEHDIDRQQRQHDRPIHPEREGVHPDETHRRRRVDGAAVEIARRTSYDASDQQAQHDRARLHDRAAPALTDDDGHEDGEAEADILRAAPRQGVRRAGVGTQGRGSGRGPDHAAAGAAGPVLEAGLDERDADESDGGAGDERGEEFLEVGRAGEGQGDFEEGAHAGGAEEGAVALGAGELGAVGGGGAVACFVHLGESAGGDGDDGEASADDGDEAGADVVGGFVDVEAGDLHRGEDAADDEGRADEVLGGGGGEVGAAGAGDDDRGADDAGEHAEGVLEAEEEGEHEGHAVVEAEEGGGAQGFVHEGEVGREKEGVVVVADEAVSVGGGC